MSNSLSNTSAVCAAAWLVVVALAFPGCAVVGRAAAPAVVNIGTFNIRYANQQDGPNAWPQRRAMVGDVLRGGDVWGLQEALPEQVAALSDDLPEFGMVVRSRDLDPTQGEACPLLFRTDTWSLDRDDSGTFWLSQTPEMPGSRSWDAALPRIATFARLIHIGTGRAIYVYNVHFDHRGAQARLESARLLAQRIAVRRHRDPVVVLGDFNAGPKSEPLRALLEDEAIAVVDAWRCAHPDAPERGTFSGFGPSLGTLRIDHLLTGKGLVVTACGIEERQPDGRWPSDHAPVSAVLRLAE